MKKKIIILLIGFMSVGFLGCGQPNKVNNTQNSATSSSQENTSDIEKLAKLFESKGFSRDFDDEPGAYKGYREIDLSNEKKQGVVIIAQDEITRSFMSSLVTPDDTKDFKDLANMLLKELIPNIKNSEEWLEYITPIAMENKDIRYYWIYGDKRITAQYKVDEILGSKMRLDITNTNSYRVMLEDIDKKYTLIELDSKGRLPQK